MERIKNGDCFNRLTVIEEMPKRQGRLIVYKCRCECGNIIIATSTNLRKGYTKSCGCLHIERASEANKTHGMSRTKLYYVWQDMKKRCNNKNHHAYKDYGARGIYVCKEWAERFMSFYQWSISNGYTEGLTIDRIDNDREYSPNNCRWVDMKAQNNNRRKKDVSLSNNPNAKAVNMYSLDGVFIKRYSSIKEACIENGISSQTCISACCRGKQKNAYRYIWKYA